MTPKFQISQFGFDSDLNFNALSKWLSDELANLTLLGLNKSNFPDRPETPPKHYVVLNWGIFGAKFQSNTKLSSNQPVSLWWVLACRRSQKIYSPKDFPLFASPVDFDPFSPSDDLSHVNIYIVSQPEENWNIPTQIALDLYLRLCLLANARVRVISPQTLGESHPTAWKDPSRDDLIIAQGPPLPTWPQHAKIVSYQWLNSFYQHVNYSKHF